MSHTHNRKTTGRRLATGCFALLLSMSGPQQGLADETNDVFRMMVMTESAKGHLVTRGRYDEAIKSIMNTKADDKSFSVQNNLCVAYTKTVQLDKARVACNLAIDARRKVRPPLGWYAAAVARGQKIDKAIALSNRGVLRAVTGDSDGAREDFMASLDLYSGIDEAQQNIARLETYVATPVITAQHTR